MSTAATPVHRRPVVVTIAVVLVYVSGLSNAGIGLLVLLSRYEVPADLVLPVSLLGAGIILFGLLSLAVASAITRGSRLARGLITLYLAGQLALHVTTIATTDWDATAIIQIAVELFIVVVLWAPPGSRHFDDR